jgi:hypothetical protein
MDRIAIVEDDSKLMSEEWSRQPSDEAEPGLLAG